MNRTIVLALAFSLTFVSCAPTYQLIDLGIHPGFDTSEPTGINSFGQVSGFSSRNNGSFRRAFFYDKPSCKMVDVGAAVPEASSEAAAINDPETCRPALARQPFWRHRSTMPSVSG